MTREIAVVGAGLAGVGVAHALTGPDADGAFDVTIFEKSRGVGGRAATRRREGTRYYYDHGANYVKEADDRTVDLVRSLGADGLVSVTEPVWPFDGDGRISESERDPEEKFTWETGITQFAKRLLAESDATVHKATRVTALAHETDDGRDGTPTPGSWTVTVRERGADEKRDNGPFDAVVATPPAPQTAELLAATETDDPATREAVTSLRERVADVSFRTTRTVVLGYEEPLDRPWYALVNTDGDHAVGWLAREECKDGHIPGGESVLIVQMAPDYSERTYDDPADRVAADVADRVARLLDTPRLADPAWTDDQGWRYAQPNDTLTDAPARDRAERAGCYLAGDWLVSDGEGRVHEAYWLGRRVADRVSDG